MQKEIDRIFARQPTTTQQNRTELDLTELLLKYRKTETQEQKEKILFLLYLPQKTELINRKTRAIEDRTAKNDFREGF
jgi:hypothetical protein